MFHTDTVVASLRSELISSSLVENPRISGEHSVTIWSKGWVLSVERAHLVRGAPVAMPGDASQGACRLTRGESGRVRTLSQLRSSP